MQISCIHVNLLRLDDRHILLGVPVVAESVPWPVCPRQWQPVDDTRKRIYPAVAGASDFAEAPSGVRRPERRSKAVLSARRSKLARTTPMCCRRS
jgi:hypothetical protein